MGSTTGVRASRRWGDRESGVTGAKRALVTIALLAALALALAQSAAARGGPLDYFALGDSVASGRGLMDMGGQCRRSPLAYPQQTRALLAERHAPVRFWFFACAGAEASAPGASGFRDFRKQVDAVLRKLTARPALVSVTIGINDTDWSNIQLTYTRLRDPDEASFERWVRSVAAEVERVVARQLGRLLEKRNVRIVLTEYFNPVNEGSVLFGPPIPCPHVDACYERTEYLIAEINSALDRARRRLKAPRQLVGAPVLDAFRGHESPSPECGSAPPAVGETWIQYPSDPASNSFPSLPPVVPGPWRGDCFHPNELGAAAIAAAVDQAAVRIGR